MDAKEEDGAKEEEGAKEKDVAAAKTEADARGSVAAALEILPARAAAEKAMEAEKVEEAAQAEEAEQTEEVKQAEKMVAKQEGVGETVVKEAEQAQQVDEPHVLPDDLWSAGCAAYGVQCMCMCSACAVHVQCLPLGLRHHPLRSTMGCMLPHLGTPRAAGCVVICRPKQWPSGSRVAARSTHAPRAAAR